MTLDTVRVAQDGCTLCRTAITDITERKRAQLALRESEEQLRLAQAAGGVGTFDWDLVTQEARCSPDYFRVMNRSARTGGKVTLAQWQSWVHADDRDRLLAALQAALEGTGEAFGEYRMVGEDSETRAILYRGQITRDAQGRAVRMLGTVLDMTERNRAAAALRESEARLKVAEAVEAERRRLFAVLETLPAMICLLTPDYHAAFANRSFREKFGESQGRHCYESCFGRAEPCEFCQSYHVLQTGQPHHWEVSGPDGSAMDAYDFPFTDVDGSPMILEMDIDITERRKAEAELAKYREHLEELVKERTAQVEAANAELRASNAELDHFNRIMVGRELRMIDLKKEVAEYVQEPVHELFEAAGTCIALRVAVLLLLRVQHQAAESHLLWMAAALAAMGLVNGAHSVASRGVAWSWLQHGATLVGGLLFGLVWCPLPASSPRRNRFFILLVAALTLTVALGVWRRPEWLPGPWVAGD